MGIVKQLDCRVAVEFPWFECARPVEADHAGRRALSRKCPDDETIPLCGQHHHDRGHFTGPFKGWTRAQMRAWLDRQIEITRELVSYRKRDGEIPW